MHFSQIIALCLFLWVPGVVLNLAVRTDWPCKDDIPTAVGKSILWPLFVLRYIGLALYAGGKTLFTLP